MDIDHAIFHFINHTCHNTFLNIFFPLWRNQLTWTPVYVLFAALLIQKYKSKSWIYISIVVFTIFITDQTSSQLIKKSVQRLRPCNDITLQPKAENLIDCGSGFSFPSSHAANHAALAIIVGFFLYNDKKNIKNGLFLWAVSIGFAQIYVGVHYPSDVLFGLLLGFCISQLVIFFIKKLIPIYMYQN